MAGRLRSGAAAPARARPLPAALLYFYSGAGVDELFLDGLGFFFIDAFFDGLGSAIDQILGFLETQAGNFAYRLDDVNLIRTRRGQNHGKFGLLFRRRSRRRAAAR